MLLAEKLRVWDLQGVETPSSMPVQGVSVICVPEVLAVGGCKAAAWVLAAFEHPVHWALLPSSMG